MIFKCLFLLENVTCNQIINITSKMFIVSIENKNYHVKISDFQLAAARTEIHIISKKQKTEY